MIFKENKKIITYCCNTVLHSSVKHNLYKISIIIFNKITIVTIILVLILKIIKKVTLKK